MNSSEAQTLDYFLDTDTRPQVSMDEMSKELKRMRMRS